MFRSWPRYAAGILNPAHLSPTQAPPQITARRSTPHYLLDGELVLYLKFDSRVWQDCTSSMAMAASGAADPRVASVWNEPSGLQVISTIVPVFVQKRACHSSPNALKPLPSCVSRAWSGKQSRASAWKSTGTTSAP